MKALSNNGRYLGQSRVKNSIYDIVVMQRFERNQFFSNLLLTCIGLRQHKT